MAGKPKPDVSKAYSTTGKNPGGRGAVPNVRGRKGPATVTPAGAAQPGKQGKRRSGNR